MKYITLLLILTACPACAGNIDAFVTSEIVTLPDCSTTVTTNCITAVRE